jgi:hypothetical protein
MVWGYQLVHHDLWDYDIPAQPSLATISLDGKERDVVIQDTKQGWSFRRPFRYHKSVRYHFGIHLIDHRLLPRPQGRLIRIPSHSRC